MRIRPALTVVASAVLLGGVVSGCQALNPGVAVRVADQTIRAEKVAAAADALCEASTERLQARGQVVPMQVVNQQVVQLLTRRSIAEQIAEAYGLAPSTAYRKARATARSRLDSLDEEARQLMVELATTQSYITSVAVAVGRQEMAGQSDQQVPRRAALQRGRQVLTRWASAHEVEIAPRYGLSWQDGRLLPDEDGTPSFPVSDLAAAASKGTPSAGYVAELPASLRCGEA